MKLWLQQKTFESFHQNSIMVHKYTHYLHVCLILFNTMSTYLVNWSLARKLLKHMYLICLCLESEVQTKRCFNSYMLRYVPVTYIVF